VPEKDPAAPWPAQGGIEVQALSLGYRDGPDILMDVSFSVKPREKLGVVGRTGSGKVSGGGRCWLTARWRSPR
jgi:ABC-type multidrug transport system fused ATPase/permease subunit